MFFDLVWAQATTPPEPTFLEKYFPLILLVMAILFIMRSSQRKQRVQQTFQAGLKRGDSVITSGGILGTIEGVTDQFIVLEIADGVRIRILKDQIAGSSKQEIVKK